MCIYTYMYVYMYIDMLYTHVCRFVLQCIHTHIRLCVCDSYSVIEIDKDCLILELLFFFSAIHYIV